MRLDLGNSLRARQSAVGLVMERVPATLELTLFAMFFATLARHPDWGYFGDQTRYAFGQWHHVVCHAWAIDA